jgi:palmitoyl-protein thioesterase
MQIKIPEYSKRLNSLEKLILVRFEQDQVIKPKDSAWFASLDEKGNLIPLRNQTWYLRDSIGIQTMDKSLKIEFISLPGEHVRVINADANRFK